MAEQEKRAYAFYGDMSRKSRAKYGEEERRDGERREVQRQKRCACR